MPLQDSRAAVGLRRLGWVLLVVVALNVIAWGLYGFSVTGTTSTAAYVGAGTLAFVLGMRHAFDADHIATIDDCTRLLIRRGERPIGLGLFFALGHSSVVFLLFVGVAVASASASQTATHAITTVMGPLSGIVAALFLLFVGVGYSLWRRNWAASATKTDEEFASAQFALLNSRRHEAVLAAQHQSQRRLHETMLNTLFAVGRGVGRTNRDLVVETCRADLAHLDTGSRYISSVPVSAVIADAAHVLDGQLTFTIADADDAVLSPIPAGVLRDALVEALRNVVRHAMTSDVFIESGVRESSASPRFPISTSASPAPSTSRLTSLEVPSRSPQSRARALRWS